MQYGSGEALKALVTHMATLAAEMPPPVKGTLSKCVVRILLEFPETDQTHRKKQSFWIILVQYDKSNF